MSRGKLYLAGVLAVSLGSATSATPAFGQDSTRKAVVIAPVEVVATRTPEAPHDVPASIEVINGADLRARGVTTLKDALSLAAGVSIAPGGDNGPASAVPEFWGLREFDAFLLVVDGIPWGGAFNPAIATLSLRDVARIEVLRGPAPVTYGATSFVGVIYVVHNEAADATSYLSSAGSNYGSGSLAADLALPLGESWKSRLSVNYDQQGFADPRTSYSSGHALWRAGKVEKDSKTWFTADVNVLRQDPASPQPRDGATLSSQVPLDANQNPDGAYLDEDRVNASAGWERPVMNGATWGTTASFTHSSQRILRGFLTTLSNTPNNSSGYPGEHRGQRPVRRHAHPLAGGFEVPVHVGRRRAVRERQRGGRDVPLHGAAERIDRARGKRSLDLRPRCQGPAPLRRRCTDRRNGGPIRG